MSGRLFLGVSVAPLAFDTLRDLAANLQQAACDPNTGAARDIACIPAMIAGAQGLPETGAEGVSVKVLTAQGREHLAYAVLGGGLTMDAQAVALLAMLVRLGHEANPAAAKLGLPLVAFRATKKAWMAQANSRLGAALQGVGLRLDLFDGLLTCTVRAMPLDRFNHLHLLDGPAHLRPVLSARGEFTWNALTTLGLRCVAPGELFALILHPDALDAARATLGEQRAAA